MTTNPLAKLIAKFAPAVPIRNLRALMSSVGRAETEAAATYAGISSAALEKKWGELVSEWAKKPSTKTVTALVEFQQHKAAAITVSAVLGQRLGLIRGEMLSSAAAREVFDQAFAAVEAGLVAQREAIEKQDKAREEETGFASESTAALAHIERLRDSIEVARQNANHSLPSGLSALLAVVGSSEA